MPAKIKFKPLPAQKKVFYDVEPFKTIVYSGGLGSGKTYLLCMKALQLSMLNKGFAGGFLCPTYSDFKRDVHPTFVDILETNRIKYRYHKTDKTYHFPWTKKPLYIFTGDRPIAGPNLAYALVNEMSLIPWERVNEMLRRVRTKDSKANQRVMAGTPEDVHGWLIDFIENNENDPKVSIIYADTRENVHIDESYRKQLEALLDEHALKVFAQGRLVRLSSDYFYYAFERENNLDNRIQYQPGQLIHCAADFNVGKMYCLFGHKNSNDEFHVFDEMFLRGDSDTNKMAMAIKDKYPLHSIQITCDAAGAARKTVGSSDVQILKDHGFAVRHKRANPRLRQRQLLVNGLLAKKKVKINANCKTLIKDLERVQQDKASFTKIKSKDDTLTHASDALDYILDFEYTLFQDRSSKMMQL